MTTLSWDLVDGNPAPGDRSVYRELSTDLAGTARTAQRALQRLDHFGRSCDESVWRGEAADAFRAKIKELPPKLEKLHRSYGTASRAMGAYGSVLDDLQPRARSLLAAAQEALRDEVVQTAARDRARAEAPDSGFLGLSTPSTPFDQAVEEAKNRQRNIRRQIDDLRDQRKAAERRVVAGLDRAHDQGIKNDSWIEKRLQGIDKWVDKHADILRKVSGALKIVSAVAGVLSFIPVLNVIAAPIALATGAAAVAIDGTLVATGNGSWKVLAVDAALMVLPGVGKLVGKGLRSGAPQLMGRVEGAITGSRAMAAVNRVGATKAGRILAAPGRGLNRVNDAVTDGLSRTGVGRRIVSASEDAAARAERHLEIGARVDDAVPSSWPPNIPRKFAKTEAVALPGGGGVLLRGLNDRGHAQGIVAQVGPTTTRGKSLTRKPVGFLTGPGGKWLGYENLGHLLARQLGGPNDLRNTVSLFRPANAPTKGYVPLAVRRDMAHFEGFVRDLADKEWVTYSATPVYKSVDDLMPDRVELEVWTSSGQVFRDTIKNYY